MLEIVFSLFVFTLFILVLTSTGILRVSHIHHKKHYRSGDVLCLRTNIAAEHQHNNWTVVSTDCGTYRLRAKNGHENFVPYVFIDTNPYFEKV